MDLIGEDSAEYDESTMSDILKKWIKILYWNRTINMFKYIVWNTFARKIFNQTLT